MSAIDDLTDDERATFVELLARLALAAALRQRQTPQPIAPSSDSVRPPEAA